MAIDTPNLAATSALAAVTSTVAPAAGAVSGLMIDTMIEWYRTGEASYDVTMAMNGCLSGLVAITSGCTSVTPWAAVIIGMVSGWVYYGASKLIIRLKIDDAVDAIPVHFFNGMWGLLAVGFFGDPQKMNYAGYNGEHPGLFMSWGQGHSDANLLLCQLCAVLFIFGWVAGVMGPFFMILNALGMYRVDPLEEEVGLDISHHRGAGYDLSPPEKQHVEELMEVRASRHGKVEVPKEVAQAADATEEKV